MHGQSGPNDKQRKLLDEEMKKKNNFLSKYKTTERTVKDDQTDKLRTTVSLKARSLHMII